MIRYYFKIFYYDFVARIVRTSSLSNSYFSALTRLLISILGVFFALLAGWKIIPVLQIILPGKNPFYLVNNFIVISLFVVYMWRTLRGYGNLFNITAFLRLPVPKNYLIYYTVLRNIINKTSIRFICFFIALFLFSRNSGFYYKGALLGLLCSAVLLLLFEIFVYITNVLSQKNTPIMVYSFIIQSVALYLYIYYNNIMHGVLNLLSEHNINNLVILLIIALIFIYTAVFITDKNIYIDSNTRKYLRNFLSLSYLFDNNPLVWMQIELIIRNKFLRKILFSNFILFSAGLAAGIFVSFSDPGKRMLAIMFMLLCSTGYIFIIAYGTNIFGWENHYSGFLFTKNVTLEQYLKAKVQFIRYYWLTFTLVILIFVPLMNVHYSFYVLLFMLYFYSVLTGAIVIQAINSFQPRHPDTSVRQYFKKITYFTGCASSLPFLLFFLFNREDMNINLNFLAGIVFLSIAGLLTHKYIYPKLLTFLGKNKYRIIGES